MCSFCHSYDDFYEGTWGVWDMTEFKTYKKALGTKWHQDREM